MRPKRVIFWAGGILAVLLALALGYYYLILDWKGRPVCHKQIMMSFLLWMDDNGMDSNSHTNAFPNVNGLSQNSLAIIRDQMGYMTWTNNYNYVPGLHEDDPGDLVLMYVNGSTRWTWHGPPPIRFEKKAWIVVPVDFKMGGRPPAGDGELSERISLKEFQTRLRRTLDFIRTNERPNWKAVVAEHTKFLNSLEQVKP